MGSLTDDEGKNLTIFGSRKIQAIFIDFIPLFSKNILLTVQGGFFFNLGAKGLYI